MKKLIFALILIPVIVLKAQYTYPDFEIADSLKGGTDTTQIINTNYGGGNPFGIGEWWIAAKDTGSTYTDSVAVFAGWIRRNPRSYAVTDTFWTRIMFKDSAWNVINVLNAPATESSWTPLMNMPFLLKLTMINAQFVNSRRWDFAIQGKKLK
jgi:hypothetical protein